MKRSGVLLLWASAMLLGFAPLHAGETRLWSFPTGVTLEAELAKSDLASATLLDKAGKEHVYKIGDLGIGDRQFMVERAGADPQILSLGELSVPEKKMPWPVKSFETLDEKATFEEASLSLLRTEHFLIAWDGKVKPDIVAEMAERLWYGMAVQHPDFRKDWGEARMMIVVTESPKTHRLVGRWYLKSLVDAGQKDEAERAALVWDEPGRKEEFHLPAPEADRYGVKQEACCYYLLDPAASFGKIAKPSFAHHLTTELIKYWPGAVEGQGAFSFVNGCAYYKEIQLAGFAVTRLGVMGSSDSWRGISLGIGFKEDWKVTLCSLVQQGKVKPDLAEVMKVEMAQSTAENMGLMESWIAFMQSTNPRLVRFDHLVRRIATDHKVPAAEEIAKIYGYDSVAAFNENWTQFILERGRK